MYVCICPCRLVRLYVGFVCMTEYSLGRLYCCFCIYVCMYVCTPLYDNIYVCVWMGIYIMGICMDVQV